MSGPSVEWRELVGADGARFRACLACPAAGSGPALLMLADADLSAAQIEEWCRRLAEDGYAVAAPASGGDVLAARLALGPWLEAAARTGAIGFGSGAALAWRLAAQGLVDTVAVYGPVTGAVGCPAVVHLAGVEGAAARPPASGLLRVYHYPDCRPGFADPLHVDHAPHEASVAHSRSLGTLRPVLGPFYDLGRLFQDHLRQEFIAHDADATMATMVAQPYVNHVPTMTGGVGHDMLKRFYKYHFIPHLPTNRQTTLLSETVGPDTVVLELVTRFTHDAEIDYLLPGILPSGKRLEVATVVVAKFRGDKLYHEHIYWDQASLLVQLGLLDPAGLPVAGVEVARKMLDQSRPANTLMARWPSSAGRPL